MWGSVLVKSKANTRDRIEVVISNKKHRINVRCDGSRTDTISHADEEVVDVERKSVVGEW